MKLHKPLAGLMLLAGLALSGSALADHHHGHGGFHGHVGIYLGTPFPYYPDPWPYYYPYYQPLIVSPPPVYIQQSPPAAESGDYYWYHCDNPQGYYPYVQTCPDGWQRVVPSPPPR
ncbi:MAG TPA: hypothetical protein VF811_00860 [Parasulfuritortus sp.]